MKSIIAEKKSIGVVESSTKNWKKLKKYQNKVKNSKKKFLQNSKKWRQRETLWRGRGAWKNRLQTKITNK